MSDLIGNSWLEQEIVEKWLSDNPIYIDDPNPNGITLKLKEAFTDERIKYTKRIEALEDEKKGLIIAADDAWLNACNDKITELQAVVDRLADDDWLTEKIIVSNYGALDEVNAELRARIDLAQQHATKEVTK